MATQYGKHLSAKATPKNRPIPGREKEMKKNTAGGYTFGVGDWAQARRFLVLGCEGGTFYVNECKLSIDNANALAASVLKAKPVVTKGKYVKGVHLSSTMGPGIRIDTVRVEAGAKA